MLSSRPRRPSAGCAREGASTRRRAPRSAKLACQLTVRTDARCAAAELAVRRIDRVASVHGTLQRRLSASLYRKNLLLEQQQIRATELV